MKNVIAILILTLSFQVAAIEPLSSELTQVATAWYGEGVILKFKDPLSYTNSSESCSNRAIMLLDTDARPNPLFKENLSILLSAFHTDSKVTISVDGCEGNDMRVIAVSINK